jgi:ribonuclease III
LKELEESIQFQFRNSELLQLAMTHPSVSHEAPEPVPHNQRLEFLGDAVLQLALTQELYEKFPDLDEGSLTKARAQLVNRHTLRQMAETLNLGAHLLLGKGEEKHGGRERPSALADAFESLLGAMFLDAGYDAARLFILRQYQEVFGPLEADSTLLNPKGDLQELLQAKTNSSPNYQLDSVQGPDHDRSFCCSVHFLEYELASGAGKSKKAAEAQAALKALKFLQSQKGESWLRDIVDQLPTLLAPPKSPTEIS